MILEIALTVSESKRLIARGVAAHPAVKRALAHGIVAIAPGTTDGYVAEELTGTPLDKPKYMTGSTLPAGADPEKLFFRTLPDLVLKRGKPLSDTTLADAIKEMKRGDVFIKGANALHYETRRVGILVGHPTGGTIGAAIGAIVGRRIVLVVPVGLEKCVAHRIEDVARFIESDADCRGAVPSLWPLDAEIVTEIEALQMLTGVTAMQSGAGGVGGAEGAVRLTLRGTPEQIEAAAALVKSIQGEPPFVPTPL